MKSRSGDKLNKTIKNLKVVLTILSFVSLGFFTACSPHTKGIISERYEYDSEGRLKCRIAPDGGKTEYKYNEQGLLTKISYPKGSVSYDYDASGNRIWMQDPLGRAEYKYDAFDRLIEVIFKYSPEKRIRYEYDPWSKISAIKILDRDRVEYQVKYEYNILGNLVNIDDGVGRIEYTHDPDKGEVVRRLPSGIMTTFSFSPLGELTALKHEDPQHRLIASYRYKYDPPGKISRLIEKTPEGLKTIKYDWDSRGYLKALRLPNGQMIRYEYDSMGNRILEEGPYGTISHKYDNLGRLIRVGNIKYKWDKNGNLFSFVQDRQKTRFVYDGRDLLSLVRLPRATIRYGWDGDRNMIFRQIGKEINYYLQNPLAPPGFTLAEYDKMGKIQSTYLYGDTLLGQRDRDGQMQYFLEDAFNSIRHITDIKGNIVGQRDYSPFGESTLIKGNIAVDFRMAGERFFPEIKSYSIGRRLYEPKIGRYLTPDPLPGYMQRFDSFNKYAHGCNAQGIFMEPRCNQTAKYRVWSYRVPEASKQILGGLQGILEDTGIYGLPFNFSGIGELAELAGRQLGGQPASWHELSKASEKTLGDFGTLTAHVSRFIGRRLDSPHHVYQPGWWRGPDQGIKSWSPEDAEEFSRAGLRLLGSKWGIGGTLDRVGKGVGNLARFYGTRMDRPYGWWSPMKWVPQKSYLDQLQKQGKQRLDTALHDPFKSAENNLGGIKLDATAEFTGILGDIKGAVYDREKQCLVLVGKEEDVSIPSIKAEDLAVALACTFDPRYGDPRFSLDPADPLNPGGPPALKAGIKKGDKIIEFNRKRIKNTTELKEELKKISRHVASTSIRTSVPLKVFRLGKEIELDITIGKPREDIAKSNLIIEKTLGIRTETEGGIGLIVVDVDDAWLKAVYKPEQIIAGTPFGKAMFEADWLLKQYAFGVSIDKEGRKKERKSSVPGFKSTVDLTFERPDTEQGQERWARFWIVSDEMKLREHGTSIYFDVAKMRVKAKKQELDPSSPTGLRDVESNDPIASAFADQFSKLYDEISKESPEFARVKELAKAVALAKWIKKENIPIDMQWVTEYVNKRIQTVERIPALLEQRERRTEIPFTQGNRSGIQTIIRQLHLFGGVDLTVNPKFKPDNGRAQSLQREVVAALRKKETGPVFKVTHEGKSLRAVVLPITKSGQEMWRNSPTIDKDGTTYQFDEEGIITKSTDKLGDITEYGYDLNKRRKTVKISGRNGWKAFGERNDLGSDWTVTDRRGNTVRYRYGTSGHLHEMEIDGKSITWNYYQGQRVATIQHEGYVERLVFDADGYIQEYEVRRTARGIMAVPEIERLSFSYDGKGNVAKIAGSCLGHMDISYSKDGLPLGITTPQGRMYFSYDSEGRIENISISNGPSISYFYDGENLGKMEIKSGDKCAEYVLNREGIVHSKDLLGGTAQYAYDKGALSSVTLGESGEAKYIYDDANRLHEVHLPNGNWIEYRYQERRGKKESSSQGQVLTVVTHSSSPLVRKTSKEADQTKLGFLDRRLQDIREASRILNNGVIMDVFGRGGGIHACVADSKGNMREMNREASRELRKLLNITAKTRGKLGKTILDRWEKFYNANLAQLAVAAHWRCPDGREIKLKPILIIKSNEVTYKYANLEKIPVLAENFVIFIASKTKESKNISETSAKDLVTKINGVPTLSRENVVFAIRLPEMGKGELMEWEREIAELERVVGKENVLFNPSKEDFNRMLQNRSKEMIVIELTHTDRGITLTENERYTSKDLLQCGDLSHIKYLIAGPGTCCLPRLEKGNFAATLREKGVGIMNTSYEEVSTETALKRLRELIRILENVEEYNLPAYYVPDMIDQLIGIPRKGTTNLGRLYYRKDSLFG